MANEIFVCETPGCSEEGKTSESIRCSSCGNDRARVKLKQLTMDRYFPSGLKSGVTINKSDYEK